MPPRLDMPHQRLMIDTRDVCRHESRFISLPLSTTSLSLLYKCFRDGSLIFRQEPNPYHTAGRPSTYNSVAYNLEILSPLYITFSRNIAIDY